MNCNIPKVSDNRLITVAKVTIEDICSGLFRTQVLDVARTLVNADKNFSITIYAINRPWMIFSHIKKYIYYKKLLNGVRVKIVYLPFLIPLRHALKYKWYSVFVTNLISFVLLISLPRTFTVYHSRSYWPAIALLKLKFDNVLLDPRSLWIQENISTGDLIEFTSSYKYWIESELKCVKNSKFITTVSAGMNDYYQELYGAKSIRLIPISYSPEVFKFSREKRIELRSINNWENNTVFVYSGSFGMSKINVGALKGIFSKVISLPDAKLVFLTMEPRSFVHKLMSDINVDMNRYEIITPKHEDMGNWLSACDIGLHALPRQIDYKTRLGTKVVEYWACGLPVIINQNVGAAVDYINSSGYGLVVGDDITLQDIFEKVNHLLKHDRNKICEFASGIFSLPIIAAEYANVYKAIANQ